MTVVQPASVARAFGEDNRRRLLDIYFESSESVSLENAWEHIYRLLLWIDMTTGLAHCYESDKSQPGRPWYQRSLRVHQWIAGQLGVRPVDLVQEVDWLFRHVLRDLAAVASEQRQQPAVQQRLRFDGLEFPEPAQDPELINIVLSILEPWLKVSPPQPVLQQLSERIYDHLRAENKRKNLVGEGFEDVLAAVILRIPETSHFELKTRPVLHDLPGFFTTPDGEKTRKVDLALTRNGGSHRRLLTAKWSIRADREEQFVSDFRTYARLERSNRPFDYVLVTNEFDPARLVAACERQIDGRPLFSVIVHVNPQAPLVAYGDAPRRSAKKVVEHVESERLISIETWLRSLL